MGNVYQSLTKKLGMENSALLPRIWQVLVDETEAAIVDAAPGTTAELACRLGLSQEEMERKLQVLFHKGVIFEQEKDGAILWRPPRHVIQFHDASCLWKEAPRELLDLWSQFMEKEYPEIPKLMTKIQAKGFLRVVPIGESLSGESRVLPYEVAAGIIEGSTRLAVTDCPCRLVGRKCSQPLEVCLQLNRGAEYAIKRGAGREINQEEAKAILRKAAAAGLVHMTENRPGIGNVICNCCPCCCVVLPFAKNEATRGVVKKSRFQARLNLDECNACGQCIKICPVGALAFNEGEKPALTAQLCLGCGLCVQECPTEALKLIIARGEEFLSS